MGKFRLKSMINVEGKKIVAEGKGMNKWIWNKGDPISH